MLKRALLSLLLMPIFNFAPGVGFCGNAPSIQLVALIPHQRGVTADAQQQLLQQCAAILRKRLESSGVASPALRIVGNDRISIDFPPPNDLKRVVGILARPGQLEFKVVDDSVAQPDLKAWVKKARSTGGMQGDFVKEAKVTVDQGEPQVSVTFTPNATAAFAELTEKNIGKRLAIVLDGELIVAPMIVAAIPGGKAQIVFGNANYQELLRQSEDLVILLNSGSLPSKISLREVQTTP